jgi:hypothetical protein
MAEAERRQPYSRVTDAETGIVFVFRHDPDAPELLHIFARHTTSPDDAIATFFDHTQETTWNQRHQRFETYSQTHGLYWFWREMGRVVMVISCFRLPEE